MTVPADRQLVMVPPLWPARMPTHCETAPPSTGCCEADVRRHAGIDDVEVASPSRRTDGAEQADTLRRRVVRREQQRLDGEALAVEAAGEGIVAALVDRSHRENPRVSEPHMPDLLNWPVKSMLPASSSSRPDHRHQLELMRVADGARSPSAGTAGSGRRS